MSWVDELRKAHYYTGGCTSGYMVHRSILPELLGIFPCCCPIDCCMERQLFYTPTKPERVDGIYRGQQIMINLDAWDSAQDSFNYASFTQGGILVQDNRDIRSLRPGWNMRDEDASAKKDDTEKQVFPRMSETSAQFVSVHDDSNSHGHLTEDASSGHVSQESSKLKESND